MIVIQSERDRENIGHRGGEAAANRSTSAAVAKTLKGIDFPKSKQDIVNYAEQHKADTEDSDAIINTLNQIRDREYNNRADLEHEIGQAE